MFRLFVACVFAGSVSILTFPRLNNKLELRPQEEWAGTFRISGQEDGNDYSGTAVVEVYGSGYRVTFIVNGRTASGVGQVRDGTLAIGWAMDGTAKNIACSTYRRKGSEIVGQWIALPSDGTMKSERLSRMREADK